MDGSLQLFVVQMVYVETGVLAAKALILSDEHTQRFNEYAYKSYWRKSSLPAIVSVHFEGIIVLGWTKCI